MSMCKFIRAIPEAEKREKAIQTIKNLKELGVEIPMELEEIRDNDIDIPQIEFNDDYEEIIEINVKDIPKQVEKIQFVIQY